MAAGRRKTANTVASHVRLRIMNRLKPDSFTTAVATARETPPSPIGALVFRFKATLFQLRRAAQNTLITRPQRFPQIEREAGSPVIAASTVQLWKDVVEHERRLQAGKIHNLRIALRRINNLEIPAGGIFSFWRHTGAPRRWQGFVEGRELREGCIIPSVGGGLCQLSNLLYQAALEAEFEIIERHAHTRILPGSAAEFGRDATVFWNYVDLRFRHKRAWRIETSMTAETLTVRFHECGKKSDQTLSAMPEKVFSPRASQNIQTARERDVPSFPASVVENKTSIISSPVTSISPSITESSTPSSCEDCGVHSCFRNTENKVSTARFGRCAFLVDEYWPEFDSFIQFERAIGDLLCVPIDGKRFRQSNYAWSVEGFRAIKQSRTATLRRAWESRRLAAQGAARQQALLHHSEQLAKSFSRSLTYDVTHLTVTQDLLPLLWREGHLGGRTFDVLMTRLPFARLHEKLDAAAHSHPKSRTLADFRGGVNLVDIEEKALQAARRIITPHNEIAQLYPEKTMLLEWHVPKREPTSTRGHRIVFPASTLGRKGAYEMRAAAQKLNLKLTVCGAELEGTDFWRDIEIEHRRFDVGLLKETALVVLPAHVEHKPRRLLQAISQGVPVIASEACGLGNAPGVITVPTGDMGALCDAIRTAIDENKNEFEYGRENF